MIKATKPEDIEKESFSIISSELEIELDSENELVIKRVIHTTADFEFAQTLKFSEGAVQKGIAALKGGATIITDTTMALSGINKPALNSLGASAVCFVNDPSVAQKAKEAEITRSQAAIDASLEIKGPKIYAIGNAPTALVRLHELMQSGKASPELVIGVPVGFVNVVESKELIMASDAPYIVAAGRKGGSSIAAAIINAMMYQIQRPSLYAV